MTRKLLDTIIYHKKPNQRNLDLAFFVLSYMKVFILISNFKYYGIDF